MCTGVTYILIYNITKHYHIHIVYSLVCAAKIYLAISKCSASHLIKLQPCIGLDWSKLNGCVLQHFHYYSACISEVY